ncbi:MAG: GAF domain-containing protein [Calditrichaeota bacterium]|nr:GAF domain-containing protein [Calditrichota bacterium]
MKSPKTHPAAVAEDTREKARAASRAERDWSSVFYRVALSISRELDLERLLWLIMDEVRQALEADRCTVFLWDEDTDELWALAAHGAEEIRFPASLGIAGHVLRTGEVLNIPDAYNDPRFNPAIDRETGYRTRSILTAPLRNHVGETIGVFQVLNKESGPFTREDELLLDAISGIAATQIENARLYAELKDSFESFVETLASIIDARDPETAGHSKRLALYCEELARLLDLSAQDTEKLRIAALLHDYGKIAVREAILYKADALTEDEQESMRNHPVFTRRILEEIHFPKTLRDVPQIAAAHHERLDGSGYPDGLTGEEIPPLARLLAVVDVFDAMTSRRSYRGRMDLRDVMEELRRGQGRLYDATYVEALEQLSVARFLEILNDGELSFMSSADREVLSGLDLRTLVNLLNTNVPTPEVRLFERYYLPDETQGCENGQT